MKLLRFVLFIGSILFVNITFSLENTVSKDITIISKGKLDSEGHMKVETSNNYHEDNKALSKIN
ncbi:hypothetical protein [Francisella frigiditurris]|uniref:Uncharacterized protein n=1 Tax=Francisella frigiditurris TaxID=1542390 RepID=A0A1J0KSV1_9GAMM|nr:hypothetical protein [Francisella frigiditurris]APC96856.1 hypothetical protein KX01_270 [Francisella frigiditurris]